MSDVIITCNLILSKVIKLINIKVHLEIKWDSRLFSSQPVKHSLHPHMVCYSIHNGMLMMVMGDVEKG